LIGVILAGGASSRFGGEPKGLKVLRGMPLAGHVHASLSMVCREVVIECVPGSGYQGLGVACISASSVHAGKGPLAGLLAGLERGGDEGQVAFAPCDMPLIAPGVFERLGREPRGAWAVSPRGDEPLVCVLPANLGDAVRAALALSPIPRVVHVLAQAGARGVMFAEEWPFANVNTPGDLVRLEALR
jgi:molybdopterin-guanine dinucleotide biosynthesis protein A